MVPNFLGCQIVRLYTWCQIVHGAKLSAVPNCPIITKRATSVKTTRFQGFQIFQKKLDFRIRNEKSYRRSAGVKTTGFFRAFQIFGFLDFWTCKEDVVVVDKSRLLRSSRRELVLASTSKGGQELGEVESRVGCLQTILTKLSVDFDMQEKLFIFNTNLIFPSIHDSLSPSNSTCTK